MSSPVAIITGSNRGIGRAIAQHLARDGARVMLTARDAPRLAQTARELSDTGATVEFFPLDLSLPEAPDQLVAHTLQTFGGINVVVNNAGATKRGEFLELSEDDWASGFALKFFGAMRLTRAAWPHLKASQGSVVNIVGVGGRTPGAQFTIGGSVNAALLSFTKALAELGIEDGVQVNAINPGAIRTERFQKRLEAFAQEHNLPLESAETAMVGEMKTTRIGEPEDIGNLVAFLVSPQGRFLQGALLDADGGQTKTI